GWRREARPLGYCQQMSAAHGSVFLVVGGRLEVREPRGSWREVAEVGFCDDVAVSQATSESRILVSGRRWFESTNDGATWSDVSPTEELPLNPQAAVGGAGYRYVYDGGILSGHLWVAEPGRPFEARKLPDSDTRIMVANPIDGREVWLGAWGG